MDFCFASDNCSGIHPKVLNAIISANQGHSRSYGADDYTDTLTQTIKAQFGQDASVYPVFNGTGANIIALQALSPRYGAVICTSKAHILCDESNAPQYVAGLRLLSADTPDGKLNPQIIRDFCLAHQGNPHAPQPSMVYLSQVSELGTCYSLDELKDIVKVAKDFNLLTYIDGARLVNACAYLNCTLKDIAQTGVDMLTLGGTKNGLMLGECLVVLNPTLDAGLKYLRKNNLQLASKLRFISAQFLAWFEEDLWLDLARHSNQMAQYLAIQLSALNINPSQPVQSNAVFVELPKAIREALHEEFYFYDWNEKTGEVRLIMSFDTNKQHIDQFIQSLRHHLTKA